jgi:hypothetical protein
MRKLRWRRSKEVEPLPKFYVGPLRLVVLIDTTKPFQLFRYQVSSCLGHLPSALEHKSIATRRAGIRKQLRGTITHWHLHCIWGNINGVPIQRPYLLPETWYRWRVAEVRSTTPTVRVLLSLLMTPPGTMIRNLRRTKRYGICWVTWGWVTWGNEFIASLDVTCCPAFEGTRETILGKNYFGDLEDVQTNMSLLRAHSVSIFGLWLMLLCKRMVLLRVGDNEVWMAVKLLRPFLGSKVTSVSLYSHCGVYRIQQFWLMATVILFVSSCSLQVTTRGDRANTDVMAGS